MPNLNQVNLIGHMTRDVEIRHTGGNQAVANVGLAVTHKWKSASGEQKEDTLFIDCEAWGRTAETLAQYTKKGDPIFLNGRLKLDQWEDKDGGKRSKIKMVIENFQFLRGKSDGDRQAAPANQSMNNNSRRTTPAALDEQDIPF